MVARTMLRGAMVFPWHFKGVSSNLPEGWERKQIMLHRRLPRFARFSSSLTLGTVVFGLSCAAVFGSELSDTTIRLGRISNGFMYLPLEYALQLIARTNRDDTSPDLTVVTTDRWGKFNSNNVFKSEPALDEEDIILQATEGYFELAKDLSGSGRAPGGAKFRIFGGLTSTDGSVLIASPNTDVTRFSWNRLAKARIFARRRNSTSNYFLKYALMSNGVARPRGGTLDIQTPHPRRPRRWRNMVDAHSPEFDYGIFFEPTASRLIRRKKGKYAAMLGPAVGPIDFTVFIAREAFLKRKPQLAQRFIDTVQRGLNWVNQARDDPERFLAVVDFAKKRWPRYHPDDLKSALQRYLQIGFWKKTTLVSKNAIVRIQDLISLSDKNPRKDEMKYMRWEDVVDPSFSDGAARKYPPPKFSPPT